MPFNVLIVEDDIALLELYILYLKRAKMRITGVVSGQEALDALQTEQFDLMIVDVQLENSMSGLDLIKMVTQMPACDATKIVILSSFPNPLQSTPSMRIDLCLNKPVNYQILSTELNDLMQETPPDLN